MTTEEVKERLRTYQRACKECRKLSRKIRDKRESMTQPRAVRTDALPGGKGNTLEAAIEKIDTLERRLDAAQSEKDKSLSDVRALIALVEDPDGRYILILRYINGVSFDDIPEQMYISDRSMWRRYNRAIDEIIKATEK